MSWSSSSQPSAASTHFSLSARPTCPSVLIPFESQLYALPVQKLFIDCEFNVSTAFVKVVGVWKNIANYQSDCMFVLPLNGTVTNVSVKIENRILETVVIPSDEATLIKKQQQDKASSTVSSSMSSTTSLLDDKKSEQGQLPPMSYEEYIPNLFRLPISNVNSTDLIHVSVLYIEPLSFSAGRYHFTLPLTFGTNLIPSNKKMSDVLKIHAVLNSVTPQTSWQCKTHELRVVKSEWPRIELEAVNVDRPKRASLVASTSNEKEAEQVSEGTREGDKKGKTELTITPAPPPINGSVDFTLSYSLSSAEILPTLIKEVTSHAAAAAAGAAAEEEGNFLLFVTPPSVDHIDRFFSRNLVFLIDRSGSMTGEPFLEASRALTVALSNLKEQDRFTVVAFDHRMDFFAKTLQPVNAINAAAAATWIRSLQPDRGGTDIQAPLEWAARILAGSTSNRGEGGSVLLPFIVLLTDGCVQNEREICRFAAVHCNDLRLLTFGIGSYCNWFFLRMLAQIGRGFSDVVVYKEKIFAQMLQLLNMAAVPIITNIALEITGVKSVELYPFPIPDLFMGAPLTISGKYSGQFPDSIVLRGLRADRGEFSVRVNTRSSEVIPVTKVFMKQRLELLTAKAWLEESPQIQQEVVALSCAESIPCAYTTMVAFETTEEKKRAFENQNDEKDALSSSASSSSSPSGGMRKSSVAKSLSQPRWYKTPKVLSAVAVGNALIVGAAAFSFGDLAGTLGNVPVIGSLGDFAHGGFDANCCNCMDSGCTDCGGCDCGTCIQC